QAGFSRIAAALADPAREAMLAALVDGRALPASELAAVAGVSPQSASAHLKTLLEGGVLTVWSQGRFRDYRIADEEVAEVIERLAVLAGAPRMRAQTQRRVAPATCLARCCYNHLAGRVGVALADALEARGFVQVADGQAQLTPVGALWLADNGITIERK